MASMGRVSSALAYPDRFFAAASYAGFDGSPKSVSARFPNDVALLLYALHQQATVGPCTIPKPRGWNPVEQGKWASWHGLGNMASTEAMRLFVKILEEEEPGWYSKVSDLIGVPVNDVEMNHNPKFGSAAENGNSYPETRVVTKENCSLSDSMDKDISSNGLCSVGVYDQWVGPSVSGQCPKPRYEHGAAVVQDKMYIFGGNHNGRYLNDLQVLDLKSWAWSKVDVKAASPISLPPCAGHSLISWDNKVLSIAGHTKDPSENIQVKLFDLQMCTWSILKTYGKPPVSRGGQSVTVVGSTIVIFGGQDAKKSLLNDLHILDLETLTWDEIDAVGVPPSPRSGHAAAIHAERYLFVFGGGSHSTCFNDLHVLDLNAMEWSEKSQKGYIPSPRAGHAGVTVGDKWFVVGGGDNHSGVPETVVLDMSTLVWSVVTTVEGRVHPASEGMSLVVTSCGGEDVIVCFGGYNGRYGNDVHVLKPRWQQSKAGNVGLVANSSRDGGMDLGDEEMKVAGLEAKKGEGSEEEGGAVVGRLNEEKEKVEERVEEEEKSWAVLKEEVAEGERECAEVHKELQHVRVQLDAEQQRCFRLEVHVAELRHKLEGMEALQKELELLQRQKALNEMQEKKQSSGDTGGVWAWLAGTPIPKQHNHDSTLS